jgi:nicotinamide mononucleotide adenylyltransferase
MRIISKKISDGTEYSDTINKKPFHVSHIQTCQRAMTLLIFTVIAAISSSVHGSLPITDHERTLMHYTKLISEENFTPGRPLVIVLPLAQEDSTNKEVGYLRDELRTSER